MTHSLLTSQRGSTLFVALILLLVITLLAISGTREVVLESRITGNFLEQQKLLNDAEATLREGEKQLTAVKKPVEPACAKDYCLHNETPTYAQSFADTEAKDSDGNTVKVTRALTYSYVTGDTSTNKWYALPTPSGDGDNASENPEYGNMMLGIGTFRYEVNTQTVNTTTNNTLQLRSNVAKVFN